MIKKDIFENSLKEKLKASNKDRIYKFLLAGGDIRGAIVHGTCLVNEMRANHELGVLETLVLGHAYLAGMLMSANLKGEDRLSMLIECSGPIKGLVVEANAFGEVRGYLKNIPIPVDHPLEDFNLSPFFGAGFLSVTRSLKDAKQPFTGRIMMEYGSIAKDLANYFMTSEQIPTSFNLSLNFDSNGEVTGAGGLFLQVMPGANEETVDGLESMVRDLPSIGELFSGTGTPRDVVMNAFKSLDPQFLDDYRVEFMCHCNQDRISNMLSMLPFEDLEDIHENGPFPVEIQCHNCNTNYEFTQTNIEKIFRKRYTH